MTADVARQRRSAVRAPRRWSIATTVAMGCLLAGTGCSHGSTASTSSTGSTASEATPTTSSADPSGAGSPATPSFKATLLQYRPDEGTNRVEVELTNRGAAPITVTGIKLDWSGTRAAPTTPKDTRYAPRQTIDLTTTYGVASCRPTDGADRARAVVTLRDGSQVTVPINNGGMRTLRAFHVRDCAEAQLASAASISLGHSYRLVHVGGQDYVRGSLVVQRSPGGSGRVPVTVTTLTGSVLLTFRPADRLPQTLAPGRQRLTLPVLIGSTLRCDAHGLSQSTQTYLISAYARTPRTGAQVRVIVTLPPSAKALAQVAVHHACQGAPPGP